MGLMGNPCQSGLKKVILLILIMIKPEIGTVKIIINVKDGLIKKSIHNNIPILIIS